MKKLNSRNYNDGREILNKFFFNNQSSIQLTFMSEVEYLFPFANGFCKLVQYLEEQDKWSIVTLRSTNVIEPTRCFGINQVISALECHI